MLHFHGTPGSRLVLAWADDDVARAGVHLVTFDRPGYGRSTQVPFSLSRVAHLAIDLVEGLGWDRFATVGWSGGGLSRSLPQPRRRAEYRRLASSQEQGHSAFEPALSEHDRRVLANPPIATAFLRDLQEAFRQGSLGGGWDNVSWVGAWDFTLDAVECPVMLWYGDEDLMAPPSFGTWLEAHLPNAKLTMRRGYGHLAAIEHLPEMLEQLTASNKT